jgi:GYD domain
MQSSNFSLFYGNIGPAGENSDGEVAQCSVEMPNGDAMTKFAVSLTSTGNARTTTVRAIPPEEFGKLAAEAP